MTFLGNIGSAFSGAADFATEAAGFASKVATDYGTIKSAFQSINPPKVVVGGFGPGAVMPPSTQSGGSQATALGIVLLAGAALALVLLTRK